MVYCYRKSGKRKRIPTLIRERIGEGAPALSIVTANPFTGATPVPAAQANLFQPQTRPSINQIRQQPFMGSQPSVADNAWGGASALPMPLLPSAQPNPFLS
uniref:Uncharacterized protein n=1 Tax=Timema shepardi TaxID=629360 RepID=A0A7R9AYR9_TIMSH|nr:unnamed protein product [Timema shepardi]